MQREVDDVSDWQLGIDGINAIEISPELRKLIHNPVGDLT